MINPYIYIEQENTELSQKIKDIVLDYYDYEITIKKPFNILVFTNKVSDQAGETFHYTIDLLRMSENEITITTFSQEKIIIGISSESMIEIVKITE